jgi:Uri superfamily endonuclease
MSAVSTPTAAASEPAASAALITYQLLIRVSQPLQQLVVGKLGVFDLPAGLYCYTGSARRNLEARLARHCSPHKKRRWHIDYLLLAPGVAVVEVARFATPECVLNQQQRGEVLIPRFGASDCHAGCGSHLKYLG